MKIIKRTKLLTIALLSALAITFSGVGALADEATAVSEEAVYTEDVAASENTPPVEGIVTGDEYEGDSIEANALEELYEIIVSYTGEICSSLAFIGTIVVAFLYKKGLLPFITRSIGSISTLLTKLRDENASGQKSASDKLENANGRLVNIENTLSKMTDALNAATERLDSAERLSGEQKSYRTVLKAQVDMLHSVFMSSALPQYQKDEIGERIQEMKKELDANERDGKAL